MKIAEIRKMKEADLKKKLEELRERLRAIRFGSAGSKSKDVKERANLRRDIARILTIFNAK